MDVPTPEEVEPAYSTSAGVVTWLRIPGLLFSLKHPSLLHPPPVGNWLLWWHHHTPCPSAEKKNLVPGFGERHVNKLHQTFTNQNTQE